MKYLLDTNACIHHLKFDNSPITARLRRELELTAVSAITKAELFYGAMRSAQPTRSLQQQQAFLMLFECLPFDSQSASIQGRIRAQLESVGTPIGPYDLQIAAIALAYDLTLVTNNVGEFSRVEGLRVQDWLVEG